MSRPTRAELTPQIKKIQEKMVTELEKHEEISFKQLLLNLELPLMSTLARAAIWQLLDYNTVQLTLDLKLKLVKSEN